MKLAKRLMMRQTGESDPYWANVGLCINASGADESTSILDAKGKTVQLVGTARIKTTLGFPAIYLDGSGASLTVASHADFAFPGDYTIEFFLYPNSWTENAVLFKVFGDGQIQFSRKGTTSALGMAKANVAWVITGSSIPSTGSMHHVGLRRSGSTTSIWVDGASIGSATDTTSYTAERIYIGKTESGTFPYPLNAYIRGVRITKGVARDLSVVPAFPFPTA